MLRGRLDIATRTRIAGWAQDDRHPGQPVALLIIANGVLLDRVVANRHRPDLAARGIGDGRHGFELVLAGGLPGLGRHVIRVVRERDGADIAASPALIEAPDAFDAEAQAGLAALLGGIDSAAGIDAAIAALNGQIDRLASRRTVCGAPTARPSGRMMRSLVIDMVMPARGRDGGSNAILSHMESLIRLGYAVSFVAADTTAAPPGGIDADWSHAPHIRSVEEVLRRDAGAFDLVYLHRLDAAARYMPLVRAHQPRARVIYSVADLHHVRLARRAMVEREPDLIALARRVRATELAVAGAADAVLTHSRTEADVLRRVLPEQNIIVAPWAIASGPVKAPRNRRCAIGFIGHFGHAPNLDAARRLAFSIMPLVRARDPSITCLIAGSAMPEAMRRWSLPGVATIGAVDELAGFFEQVRLTVAPMAYGAGIKGKVLDSLAAGIPCIVTPVAIEGIDWPAALGSCVAADDAGLAAAILSLHRDASAYRRLAAAGRALIARDWSEARVDNALREAAGITAQAKAA